MAAFENLRRALAPRAMSKDLVHLPQTGLVAHHPEAKALLKSYSQDIAAAAGSHHGWGGQWSTERAVTMGYERIVWVFKCINRIAGDQARLPFEVRDRRGQVIDGHYLADMLNDGQANPLETGRQFRKRLSAQILLSKRGAFVEVTRDMLGDVQRLDLLPPDQVEVVPGLGENPISHYILHRRIGGAIPLDPENVIWFRDPHPIDPYMGSTVLEALSMSIELDYFARLYNVNFTRNDGRPGGVLAVAGTGENGDVDQRTLDKIEERFGSGPMEAGRTTVLTGALTYTDLAAKPRDMAWSEATTAAKREILAGFGVGESVIGDASGKTFDNAEQEQENYWTITQPEHQGLVLTGFHSLTDPRERGHFNTDEIEVLQRAKRARLALAREEVAAGLRSPYSYAVLAGHADEVESTPHTRALYLPSGKTPLPSSKEDEIALGLSTDPAAAAAPAGPPGGDGFGGPPEAVPGEVVDPAAIAAGPAAPPSDTGDPLPITAPPVDPAAAEPTTAPAAEPEVAPTDPNPPAPETVAPPAPEAEGATVAELIANARAAMDAADIATADPEDPLADDEETA